MVAMPNPGDQILIPDLQSDAPLKLRDDTTPRTPQDEGRSLVDLSHFPPHISPANQSFQSGKTANSKSSNGTKKSPDNSTSGNKKREAREVQIEMAIRRVFNLDTVTQSFCVQLLVITTWPLTHQELRETPPPAEEDDDGHWVPKWTPNYRIKSVLEQFACERSFRVKEADGQIYAVQEAHHRVSIYERLELQLFPHDCQELTIELESSMTTAQVMWVPSKDQNCVQLSKDRCYLDDFELIHDFPFTWCFNILNHHHKQVPGLKVILHVVRNSHFYMVNVTFVTFVLCSLVLTTWSMNPSDLEARLTLDFTLVLTVIAFKLILLGMLPRVSYMTQLDKYVMAGFLFLICATMSHAILPMFYFDKGDVSELTREPDFFSGEIDLLNCDVISFYAFAGVWALFNLVWGINFHIAGSREYAHFVRHAKQQQEGFDTNHQTLLKTASMARGLEQMCQSEQMARIGSEKSSRYSSSGKQSISGHSFTANISQRMSRLFTPNQTVNTPTK